MKKFIHILHFKLNEKIFMKLLKVAKQKNKSISSMINMIFEHSLPFIEKNHISFQDKDSRYQRISNTKEKRHSILAYMPEEYYRKLKQIHQDMNVYSIAQIMRKIIRYFLDACDKYDIDGLLNRTGRILKYWKLEKEKLKNTKTQIMIQLFNKIYSPSYISITYDQYSRPMIFKFL